MHFCTVRAAGCGFLPEIHDFVLPGRRAGQQIGAVHPHQCERQEEAIPRHPSAFVGEWRQVDYLLYRLRGDGSFGRRRGCFEAQVSERVAQNIHLSEFFIVELFLRAVIDGFDARNIQRQCPVALVFGCSFTFLLSVGASLRRLRFDELHESFDERCRDLADVERIAANVSSQRVEGCHVNRCRTGIHPRRFLPHIRYEIEPESLSAFQS